MFKRFLFNCALTFSFLTLVHVVADVIEGPRGPVEFIGLKDWTAPDLFNAIKETDPDKPFHACAAVMIRELDFPDAAAFGFFKQQEDGSMEMYTVVVGIEDSSHVQYRAVGNDKIKLPDTWQQFQAAAEESFSSVAAAAQVHFLLAVPETAAQLVELSDEEAEEAIHQVVEMFGSDVDSIDELRTFHDSIDKETDAAFALEVFETAESWSARFVATIVLAQFPENDSSWHGLAKSLIDPAPQVRDVATKALEGLVQAELAVPVQWSNARETLIALLGGTYPFAFNDILDVLVATEIEAEFARELLQERPDLLLAVLGVEHDKFRESAHTFLKTISGRDFEKDVEAWNKWIHESKSESTPSE